MEEFEKKIWSLERQLFQARTLSEIAQALNSCRDRDAVYANVLATIAGAFGARAAMALACEDGGWNVAATHGALITPADKITQELNADFASASASKQQSLLANLTNNGANADPDYSIWEHIRIQDKVVGGVFLGRKILREPYSREDEHLIRAACNFAANTLENIQLYAELEAAKIRLTAENQTLRQQVRHETDRRKIVGNSTGVRKVLQDIQSFARGDASVLIIGETGTGKELVARAIHNAGFRVNGPFVAINCTAIPENLAESEFFGIERGAATGVTKRIGYFEQADGGTIFIDEVGDMSLNLQAKLLRTLQEHTVRRVGGNREIKIDVRVVAATNKDLKAEIKAGNFREDLYYRLGVLELQIPPLRKRKDDIAVLASHFLEKMQQRLNNKVEGFSAEAIQVMEKYPWPGNIRELENEIERVVTLADEGKTIEADHLSPHLSEETTPDLFNLDNMPETLREAVDRLESLLISRALKSAKGNKSEVARRLGLSRLGLQRKMERMNLKYEGEANDAPDET